MRRSSSKSAKQKAVGELVMGTLPLPTNQVRVLYVHRNHAEMLNGKGVQVPSWNPQQKLSLSEFTADS